MGPVRSFLRNSWVHSIRRLRFRRRYRFLFCLVYPYSPLHTLVLVLVSLDGLNVSPYSVPRFHSVRSALTTPLFPHLLYPLTTSSTTATPPSTTKTNSPAKSPAIPGSPPNAPPVPHPEPTPPPPSPPNNPPPNSPSPAQAPPPPSSRNRRLRRKPATRHSSRDWGRRMRCGQRVFRLIRGGSTLGLDRVDLLHRRGSRGRGDRGDWGWRSLRRIRWGL